MKNKFKNFIESFTEFLFPSNITCLCCGKDLFIPNDRYALCPECTKGLYIIKTCCPRCGKLNQFGEYCNICSNIKIYFERNYACLVYDGVIKNIVYNFKFNDRRYFYKYLASFLMDKIVSENLEFDLITAVPMNKKHLRERGYNQAELMAKEVSKRTGIKYSNEIYKKDNCSDQVGKDWKDRIENVKDTFYVKNDDAFKDKTVLVIDDIITTGSTLNSVAKTLVESGAKKVICLTLCGVRFNDDPNAPIKEYSKIQKEIY